MPRIEPLKEIDISPSAHIVFDQHTAAYNSRITNMKATLGHSLLAFEVYMMWYPLYNEVKKILGERLAYLYAYSISYASNCPLCSTYFRKIIIDAGETPENRPPASRSRCGRRRALHAGARRVPRTLQARCGRLPVLPDRQSRT